MSDIPRLTKQIIDFCEERDWLKYMTPKDLAISLSIEAAEVLEHVQWKSTEEIQHALSNPNGKEAFADELADVFAYLLELAYVTDIDLATALEKKMEKNAIKYTVDGSRGKHTNKY
ncbi:MAG: nucleotide pyrophosphohydrolase [Candidatus Magasanikbacteria bacterium]|uniref:Nucleotide pyrophosphohydrolase n=1 Tax=Candidatus Magasanikbacteria bacterium CG10_big_fil_rev_8_21_14_0_10_38_6 TaxID=1974647 RepID=A0A2M6P2C8_9BACT|nr:nucleotide pyrophosphohydrolase [Candidatus Magasanikbacteria bacterium]PIR77885.1 MAG: nucleotide pyrophosphohydrolase [Candidatus Magasanikbacteria bacterium CG10_big_fil_rev_8_21_14_0_10_38_6]